MLSNTAEATEKRLWSLYGPGFISKNTELPVWSQVFRLSDCSGHMLWGGGELTAFRVALSFPPVLGSCITPSPLSHTCKSKTFTDESNKHTYLDLISLRIAFELWTSTYFVTLAIYIFTFWWQQQTYLCTYRHDCVITVSREIVRHLWMWEFIQKGHWWQW